MVYAMVGIGVVGFIVQGHHMLTSGMSPAAGCIHDYNYGCGRSYWSEDIPTGLLLYGEAV